jgi:hypothetical protein
MPIDRSTWQPSFVGREPVHCALNPFSQMARHVLMSARDHPGLISRLGIDGREGLAVLGTISILGE